MSDPKKTAAAGPQPAPDPKRRLSPLTEAEVMMRMDKLLGRLPAKAAARVLAWLCLKAADEQGGDFSITLKRIAESAPPETKS